MARERERMKNLFKEKDRVLEEVKTQLSTILNVPVYFTDEEERYGEVIWNFETPFDENDKNLIFSIYFSPDSNKFYSDIGRLQDYEKEEYQKVKKYVKKLNGE